MGVYFSIYLSAAHMGEGVTYIRKSSFKMKYCFPVQVKKDGGIHLEFLLHIQRITALPFSVLKFVRHC